MPTAQTVSVYTTSATAAVSGVYTTIAFQAEYFDTDAFHDNSTNNSRLTVPTGLGGKYFVCATLFLTSGAAALNTILRLSKNNVAETRWGINYIVANDRIAVSATGVFTLNATDYMEAQIYQNTGANRNVDAAEGQGHFSMYRIGA